MPRDRNMDDPVEAAIWERMDMVAANILGVKDRIRYLEPEDAGRLRGVVLRELNEFTDFCIALVKLSADEDASINELAIDMLKDIHAAVVPSIIAGPG